MKHLIAILTILCFFNANAQFDDTTFEVTLSDLETNIYEKDTISKALVIKEKGHSYFDNHTNWLETTIEKKIKIFDKSDEDNITVEIPLFKKNNKRKELAFEIKATTHNLVNGKIEKTYLQQSEIFETKINESNSVIKFTLPKVQNGSVITYSYKLQTPFYFKYHGWYFQENIPKINSQYISSIPSIYEYNIKLIGHQNLDTHHSEVERGCYVVGSLNGRKLLRDCSVTTFAMKNIPAFKEDPYMTSKYNFISRIDFELSAYDNGYEIEAVTKKWKDVDIEFKIDESVGKQMKKSLAKNLLPESITTISDKTEKAKAIYRFVQENFNWNKTNQIHSDVSIKRLIKSKVGKTSEINILLYNLLNLEKFESNVVLLSTRDNGFATKLYPVISDFNYAITQLNIDGKSYFLDATNKYLAFGELPYKCLNHYGRKLDFKNGSSWVDIEASNLSSIRQKIKLKIDSEEEALLGNIETTYLGYHSFGKKRRYFSNKNEYLENLENNLEELNPNNHKIQSEGPSDTKFVESYDVEYLDLNIVDNKIYLNPFLIKFFKTNPFKLQQRTYPIDFGYKDSFISSIQIDLGNNYTVEQLPENLQTKLPENGGSLIFSTQMMNNKLVLFLKMSFNKPRYSSDIYPYLKKIMNQLVEIQTKSIIVLQKKS